MRKVRDGSGTGHSHVEQVELLKLQKNGQFPDEIVKKAVSFPMTFVCLLLIDKTKSKEKTYM